MRPIVQHPSVRAPIVAAPPAREALMAAVPVAPCQLGQRRSAGRQKAGSSRPGIDGRMRARFRDGDPDAVRAIYSEYGRLVYAIAYRLLGNRSLSEEATQQTFLKAWRASTTIDPNRELGPWLVTIARRVAIDLYRREARRAAAPLEAVAADDPALVSLPATLEAAHEIWEVRRAVCALPTEDEQVVRLQHFEGLTHAQIAQRLGVPVGTVKSRSFRAHKRLATELRHLRQE